MDGLTSLLLLLSTPLFFLKIIQYTSPTPKEEAAAAATTTTTREEAEKDRARMVDYQVVCCMCGDVGFPDRLFRCIRCRNRHQHSYCSNYYGESLEPIEQCDWCQSEARNSLKHGSSTSRKSTSGNGMKSEYLGGDEVKQNERDNRGDHHKAGGKNPGSHGAPSPKTATRRYKLLKDVMC